MLLHAHMYAISAALAFLLLAAGLFLFLLAFLHVYDRRLVENTPTSKCRSVALGPVELAGKVVATKPIASLIAQIPCVFSQVHVQQFVRRGRSERWTTVKKQKFKMPFYVEDATGKTKVDPEVAEFELVPDVSYSAMDDTAQWDKRALERANNLRDSRPLYDSLREYCNLRGIMLDAPTRFVETDLCPGDPVLVLGTATEQEKVAGDDRVIIRSSVRCPLLISESDQPQLVRLLLRRAKQRFAIGAGLSTAGSALLLRAAAPAGSAQPMPTNFPDLVQYWEPYLQQAATLAIPLLVLIGAIVYLIIIYNGFIMLRNEVDRAWANVGVLLKQRSDLVPNLVEICKGYMQHEQQTLQAVALARTNWTEARQPEQKLRAAQESTTALRQVFATAENYPLLRANEGFTQLQESITTLEEQIADRRELYNAAVGAFNMRIAEIPDAWVARLLGYRPRTFFAASPGGTQAKTVARD